MKLSGKPFFKPCRSNSLIARAVALRSFGICTHNSPFASHQAANYSCASNGLPSVGLLPLSRSISHLKRKQSSAAAHGFPLLDSHLYSLQYFADINLSPLYPTFIVSCHSYFSLFFSGGTTFPKMSICPFISSLIRFCRYILFPIQTTHTQLPSHRPLSYAQNRLF